MEFLQAALIRPTIIISYSRVMNTSGRKNGETCHVYWTKKPIMFIKCLHYNLIKFSRIIKYIKMHNVYC